MQAMLMPSFADLKQRKRHMARFAFVLSIYFMTAHCVWGFADEHPQWIVELYEQEDLIQVDGAAPLVCLNATVDAVTALGYESCTRIEVDASKQTSSETSVAMVATAEKDTVTIRSSRMIPIESLIAFLPHLDAALTKRVVLEQANRQSRGQRDDHPMQPSCGSRAF
jgi:hypothetical protein